MKVERLKGAAGLMRQPVVSKRGYGYSPVQVLMKSIPMLDNDQLTISTTASEKCVPRRFCYKHE